MTLFMSKNIKQLRCEGEFTNVDTKLTHMAVYLEQRIIKQWKAKKLFQKNKRKYEAVVTES